MTEQAQAEDRRALHERIHEWRLSGEAGYDQAIGLLCEAEAELSRLSRVEQALREIVASLRDLARHEDREAGNALKANNVGLANLSYHTACARRRGFTFCADRLDAALSVSPEAQPEEGK